MRVEGYFLLSSIQLVRDEGYFLFSYACEVFQTPFSTESPIRAEINVLLCVSHFIINDPTPPETPCNNPAPPSGCHDHQGAYGWEGQPLGGGVGQRNPARPGPEGGAV